MKMSEYEPPVIVEGFQTKTTVLVLNSADALNDTATAE